MQELRLYRYGITPKIRFATIEATQAYFNNQLKYRKFDIEGCIITQGTGYIDFDIYVPYEEAIRFSSLLVKNDSADGHSFIAFVDRIDYNNFNGINSYVRLYFTIDWWSTLLYSGQDISKYVEGNVLRSHVNDVTAKQGEYYYPTMANTKLEAEYYIPQFETTKLPWGARDKVFLYVLTTKPIETVGGLAVYVPQIHQVGRMEYKSPLTLVIIPMFNTRVRYEILSATAEDNREEIIVNIGEESLSLEDLSDSSIVSIFATNFNPYYNESSNLIDFGYIGSDNSDYRVSFMELTARIGSMRGYSIGLKSKPDIVSSSDLDTPRKLRFAYIPQTYDDYIGKIWKQYFPPYKFSFLSTNNSNYCIPTQYCFEEDALEINILESVGGYVVYTDDAVNFDKAKYRMLVDNTNYERTTTNDIFTAIKATSNIIRSFGNTAKSLQGMVNSYNSQQYLNMLGSGSNIPADIYDTYTANTKMMRDGESGTSIAPSSLQAYFNPLSIKIVEPAYPSIDDLRKDLALYGYNTYLHPHVILESHKRKYFNYINTSNCEITLNSLSQQAREHIEAMFNNGVWLWQTTDSFGNFEVPNYPIIMED